MIILYTIDFLVLMYLLETLLKFEEDIKKSKYIIGHNINFDLKILGAR